MTLDEFSRLADTWGGEIARWPDRVRDTAEAFARVHPEAPLILARASALDGWVTDHAPVVADERVTAATRGVMSRIATAGSDPAPRSVLLHWLAPAMSFACAAGLGIYLGFAYPVLSGPGNSIAGNALVMILQEDTMLSWIH